MSSELNTPYPASAPARDRWVVARRGARLPVSADRPAGFFTEEERAEDGTAARVTTVFLTNRECPWRCVMCDLWRHTLTESVPAGAVPAQIRHALAQPGAGAGVRQLKLYNSGSFFDPRAIPPADLPDIARLVAGFERVIVECHPSLVGPSAVGFRDALGGAKLEVAMGLETAHPETLARLNKRMTTNTFRRAADFLRAHGIALRAFVLVQPPFMPDESEALEWARRSLEFAFDCGATVGALIPTRRGNGALESLEAQGLFRPPRLAALETAMEQGLALRRGRVFADVWDLEVFSDCRACFPARRARLVRMNLEQQVPPRVNCPACGAEG